MTPLTITGAEEWAPYEPSAVSGSDQASSRSATLELSIEPLALRLFAASTPGYPEPFKVSSSPEDDEPHPASAATSTMAMRPSAGSKALGILSRLTSTPPD